MNATTPVLTGFVRHGWEYNHPTTCVRSCSKAGFAYAGVAHGGSCYCGHSQPTTVARYVTIMMNISEPISKIYVQTGNIAYSISTIKQNKT